MTPDIPREQISIEDPEACFERQQGVLFSVAVLHNDGSFINMVVFPTPMGSAMNSDLPRMENC